MLYDDGRCNNFGYVGIDMTLIHQHPSVTDLGFADNSRHMCRSLIVRCECQEPITKPLIGDLQNADGRLTMPSYVSMR